MDTSRPGDTGGLVAPSDRAAPAWAALGLTDTGAQDLRAAVELVSCGAAASVLLGNFPDAAVLLDADLELGDDVVVEPRVRPGGGAFDIVVRRAVAPRA